MTLFKSLKQAVINKDEFSILIIFNRILIDNDLETAMEVLNSAIKDTKQGE